MQNRQEFDFGDLDELLIGLKEVNLRELGQRIAFLRKNFNMSYQLFSSFLSIPISSLCDLEHGKSKQLTSHLRLGLARACKRFFISKRWLLEGKGEVFEDLPCDYLLLYNVQDFLHCEALKKFILSHTPKSPKNMVIDDLYLSKLLEKIKPELDAFWREFIHFKEIVCLYFSSGLYSLNEKQKQKIYLLTEAGQEKVKKLLRIPEEFDWIKWLESQQKIKEPVAPFRQAYTELTKLILFDQFVPAATRMPNRPQLCFDCDLIICPSKIREKDGHCPRCGEKLVDLIEFKPVV